MRNAFEAMPPAGGASARRRAPTGLRQATRRSWSTSRTPGEGMDARRAEQAFDDFSTTKPTGSGLGRGLRVVCARNGGQLSSRPGEGTDGLFSASYFPRAARDRNVLRHRAGIWCAGVESGFGASCGSAATSNERSAGVVPSPAARPVLWCRSRMKSPRSSGLALSSSPARSGRAQAPSGSPRPPNFAVAAFVALVIPAMRAYPGGTVWDPTTRGNHFWLNH